MSTAQTDPATPVLGAKRDAGKPRWTLLPLRALSRVVDVLEFGARKYSAGNWRHVPDARARYLDAAWRHLVARCEGVALDPESGLPHAAHAVACLLFVLAFDEEATGG